MITTKTTDEVVAQKMIDILVSVTKLEPEQIHLDHTLNELGVDSIQFFELMSLIEEKFDFNLDPEDLDPQNFQFVRSFIEFIKRRVL